MVETQREQIASLLATKQKNKEVLTMLEAKVQDQTEEIAVLTRALDLKANDTNRTADHAEQTQVDHLIR